MAISIIEVAKMAKTKTNSKSVHAAINRVVAGLSGAWIVAKLAMRLVAPACTPNNDRPTAPSAETAHELPPEQQAQYAISVTKQTTARLGGKSEPRP